MSLWTYLAIVAGALALAIVVLVVVASTRQEVGYGWDEYEVRHDWEE